MEKERGKVSKGYIERMRELVKKKKKAYAPYGGDSFNPKGGKVGKEESEQRLDKKYYKTVIVLEEIKLARVKSKLIPLRLNMED